MKKAMMGLVVMAMVFGVWAVVWGYQVMLMDDSGRMRIYEVHENSGGGVNIWNMETGKLYHSRPSGGSRYYLDMDTGESFWVRPSYPSVEVPPIIIPGLE